MNERTASILFVAAAAILFIFAFFVVFNASGETVQVLETQDGDTITVAEGDTLQVVLSGNPTTGYNWSTTHIDNAVLSQVGEPVFDAESDLVGAPGTITMTYKTVGAGTSPVSLDYGPVAGGEAEHTFSITVVVE